MAHFLLFTQLMIMSQIIPSRWSPYSQISAFKFNDGFVIPFRVKKLLSFHVSLILCTVMSVKHTKNCVQIMFILRRTSLNSIFLVGFNFWCPSELFVCLTKCGLFYRNVLYRLFINEQCDHDRLHNLKYVYSDLTVSNLNSSHKHVSNRIISCLVYLEVHD